MILMIGRWRILKSGIRVHGISAADDIWFTCCAFHNMLLDVDGLNKQWKKGVKSIFEGELGWHTSDDIEVYAPKIFRRVHGGGGLGNPRQLDLCPVGGNDYGYNYIEEIPIEENVVAVPKRTYKILNMTNNNFRNNLVTSFHKRWTDKDIEWPSRTGKMAK
jgi:hypothetical protein